MMGIDCGTDFYIAAFKNDELVYDVMIVRSECKDDGHFNDLIAWEMVKAKKIST